MSLDCKYECYQIGGPWIAENPSCPIHGQGGIEERELEERVRVLEDKLKELEDKICSE